MKLKWFILGCFVCSLLVTQRWTVVSAQQSIDFTRDIQPIFNTHCVSCHGAKKAAGQLRLDNKASAMKGGISGAIILPGNANASILLTRVTGSDGQAKMPLGGEPLNPEQIALLRQWINAGAIWPSTDESPISNLKSEIPTHWAYKKPLRPAIPTVKNQSWVRNPIDAFVLARLEKEGLQPSPEANKETLLRRVYLDLIGLPPSVKEIDEFLNDSSPNAYEKVVDRLLASQHYGERWARPWLDLARYADSNGYEKDNLRTMWKYRDWVINALNADMPFDQFTIEQLAGDMLPKPSKDQLIATGFHRNTLINQEGGIDPEEARFEILVDRVNTTATVWLGSTMGCAQCHNHKYDPFSQRDYYKLMAFFNSSQWEYGYQGEGMGEETRWVKEPILDLPTPEQDAKRKVIEAEIQQLQTKLKTQTPELDAAQAAWERAMLDEEKQWTVLEPNEIKAVNGATLTKQADKSVLASGANPEAETYVVTTRTELKNITALRLEAMTDPSLPKGGPGRDPYGNFLLTGIEIEAAPANGKPQLIAFKSASVDNQASRIEPKKFFTKEGDTPPIDKPTGWLVNATSDTKRAHRNAVFVAEKPFGFLGGTTLTIKLKQLGGSVGQGIGRFRLSVTTSKEPTKITSVPATQKLVLALAASARTEKQAKDLASLHRSLTPLLKADRERLSALQKELRDLNIVTALVMGEKPGYEKPSAPMRIRGAFLSPGEKVYADVPAFLPRLPETLPYNRLGLAKWLVSEDNPLTARVTVNRFWEQFFGRGLVLTAEDFGTQGEAPSHPELLDWLAVELMDGATGRVGDRANPKSKIQNPKWSMKALHRLIVTSATYRQSSEFNPKSKIQNPKSDDPDNRLLARGPRFRLEAEMIRDLGLTASGLLSRKLGGPSVFPLQPEGVWTSPYSSEKWRTSEGEDRYRRSLYTFIRRTAPFPQMMTFDGTSRETCTVRRVRTNTPLQALTMLNDEAAMENARGLAARMLREGGATLPARLTYGFRACLMRKPEAAELERLVALYKQQLTNFTAQPNTALKISQDSKLANKAEFAALTMVANVLLNLDETVTKE
ncbi:MAG TPA: PSD1 and planctomycete cytochrome C domain-containing protein [Blastocatellia bacterium]|nr:PSD1 and planctomycete cytochrome C domain-containing protein [Blastocatellia bacterium]